VNVYAESARLSAAAGVGAPGNTVEIEARSVAAAAGNAGVALFDPTNISVDPVGTVPVQRVQADGTTVAEADAAPLSGVTRTGGLTLLTTGNGTPIANLPAFTVQTTLTQLSQAHPVSQLFEQVVRISNPTGSTIDAARVFISNLPSGTTVHNATGSQGGVPFIQYNLPLLAGQSVDLTIEYLVPRNASGQFIVEAIPTAPVFFWEAVPPLAPLTPVGTVLSGVNVFRWTDNRAVVQFASVVGLNYHVQWSDDGGTTWITARPVVAGTNDVISWIDQGPPKTFTDSATAPGRTYRVIRIN